MTGAVQKIKRVLLRQYPDRWAIAGFAIFFGLFASLLASIVIRDPKSTAWEIAKASWAPMSLFSGAIALMANQRWGYLLLCAPCLVLAAMLLLSWQVISSAIFAYMAVVLIIAYRAES